MTKDYRLGPGQRVGNFIYRRLTLWGLGAGYRHILTVTGRRTGLPRSTPVDVMDVDGARYLVAPYGEVGWVHNARAAGVVRLRRGSSEQEFGVREVAATEAAPVIRAYVRAVPVTRAYWDVDEGATEADFLAEAAHHPVFRLAPR